MTHLMTEQTSSQSKLHAARSLLFGTAVGDALGVPFEFMERGSFAVDGMTGWGTHHQPPGTWSDDTSLTLALADALSGGRCDIRRAARNFIAWRAEGAWTADGTVFDIGIATDAAISRLMDGRDPSAAGGRDIRDNGNGSLMRIAVQ